ncbi:MAG: tetratricopeptide repeat protein [Candidatus Adiutrix sp.]|jgi:hypothetical protein|nr:tetratricopeptide repeat protein [Candidatus Adiutrix sp.]
MNKAAVFVILLLAVLLPTGCAGTSNTAGKLPAGVTLGELRGPGQEQLRQALKKRLGGGPQQMILSGEISLAQTRSSERETVPQTVAAGPPYIVYKADPFTRRVWPVEERPMAVAFNNYDFQRQSGQVVLDWRLADKNGLLADSGRLATDIDRTRGGYLARRGLAPSLNGPASDAALQNRLAERLAEDLARLLALDLGRNPGALELEGGDDALSREAKSLASSGEWDEARSRWLELLRQNPQYAPALYNLGLYWEQRQDPEEAWRYYRAAFLSEGSPRHRRALTRLTETLRRADRLPQRGSSPTK